MAQLVDGLPAFSLGFNCHHLVVAHSYNSIVQERRQKDQMFKVILRNLESSRVACTTRDPVPINYIYIYIFVNR